MRLLDKDAILQEDFSDEFWEPCDYDSFRALISIYPEVDVETTDIKSEVAKEIFAEIYTTTESVYNDYVRTTGRAGMIDYAFTVKLEHAINELENKYTKGE